MNVGYVGKSEEFDTVYTYRFTIPLFIFST